MKVGIAGAGSIVPGFLNAASEVEGIKVQAICCTPRGIENARKIAQEYGIDQVFTDYDEMLENREIDTVYVAVPNHLHYPFAQKALQKGKNAIVEKPFVTEGEQAEELRKLAEEKHLFLFEAIPNIYLPDYQKVRELVKELGNIKIIQLNYSQYSRRYDAFKAGEILPAFDPAKAGGALMDLGVYNVHFVTGLFGYPEEARYYPNVERDIDTSGILVMKYGDRQCVCVAAKDCRAPVTVNIQGDKGFIHSDASPNMFDHFEYSSNAGEAENYALFAEVGHDRMYYELKEFERAISDGDWQFMMERLDHSLKVTELMEKVRKQAGLSF